MTKAIAVSRDGEIKAIFKEGNAWWCWLLDHQPQSVSWAMKYEGWDAEEIEINESEYTIGGFRNSQYIRK